VCDGHPDCPLQDDELPFACEKEPLSSSRNPSHESNSHSILKRERRSKESYDDEKERESDDIILKRRSPKSISTNDVSTKKKSHGREKKSETSEATTTDPTTSFGFDWNAMEDQYNKGKKSHSNHSAEQNETATTVKATKIIPSADIKPIAYSHTGSGFFFINFGNIVSGTDNTLGRGHDVGNGRDNGNNNGPRLVADPTKDPEKPTPTTEENTETLISRVKEEPLPLFGKPSVNS
jgi:hypothetical protein